MADERQGRDMDQETHQSQAPPLCSTGCGFYGLPRNEGMCSVCYENFVQRRNRSVSISVSPPGSSTGGSVGESHVAQRSNRSTVPSHRSGPTTASTAESPSGAKTSLTADRWPGSCMSDEAAAVGSEQEGRCSSGGLATVPSTQRPAPGNSTGKKCSHKSKKRKLEEPPENTDVKTASGPDTPAEAGEKPKAKKSRCFMCRKKIGLTGFDCRCGNVFCSAHRYSDTHNCTFDYKAEAAEKIRKENPVVVGEKFQRI